MLYKFENFFFLNTGNLIINRATSLSYKHGVPERLLSQSNKIYEIMGTSKTSICQIFSKLLKNWNCNPGLYSINPIFYLFHELGKLRMFKIRRIDTSIFHCIICSQLLLFCFPEIVSMNAFLNDQINIFCCKHLKCYFFFAYIVFTFYVYLLPVTNKRS